MNASDSTTRSSGRKAETDQKTLQITGIVPGTYPLDAFLYFSGSDGGQVSDHQTVNVTITGGQVTQLTVDFHPI